MQIIINEGEEISRKKYARLLNHIDSELSSTADTSVREKYLYLGEKMSHYILENTGNLCGKKRHLQISLQMPL